MAKPTIPEVRDRFVAYYRKHPTWGVLHIILEDFNVSDSDVRWCIEHAKEIGDRDGAELGSILLQMSKTQRMKMARTG